MIDRKEIEAVAELAMLSTQDACFDTLAADFAKIVAMAERLETLTVGEEPPPPTEGNRFRPDTVVPGLSREAALAVAPASEAGCVLVPRVVE